MAFNPIAVASSMVAMASNLINISGPSRELWARELNVGHGWIFTEHVQNPSLAILSHLTHTQLAQQNAGMFGTWLPRATDGYSDHGTKVSMDLSFLLVGWRPSLLGWRPSLVD